MKTFLLKQMKQLSKNAVAKVATLSFKPSLLPYTLLTAAMAVTVSVAYAEQPLNDAELEAKYIEVKIKPVCTTQKAEEKKQSCHDTDAFLVIVTNKQDKTLASDDTRSKASDNSDALLASVFDNIRLLGGTDVLGVPAGVANTGVPLMFGNENYSYKWAGNLNQIFQPVILYGVNGIQPGIAFSVYDTSNLGYGFREEAHFPDGLPQVTIQSITISPRN
jgi:hypothetical protein